jgi:arsenate reductase
VTRVVFACTHNAGRSQIAAAFFTQLADPAKATAVSAGTEPGKEIHPEVLAAMKEVAIDLSKARPQLLTAELAAGASFMVTMGCGEECPYLPGVKILDWPLEDPKGQPLARVREIRDDIRERVAGFVRDRGWGAS